MDKPIKRVEELKPFSRDHHHTLLLCWKIKAGFKKNIPVNRIKAYSDWFFKNHIIGHFEMEEEYLFPVLGRDHKLIQQAFEEHKKLTELFTDKTNIEESLNLIPELLESHIRFEERTLFNEIQKAASADQLEKFQHIHSDEKFTDNLSDEFWLYEK
ncbi:MAG TPA: hemerythrin domain-containing protein [Ignavibacteria bacterium]|nr:hemerythrin domain-containing protein [Ignavibacteria bacterium]HQY52856.1 hemerythrin domain-containing protein [Ignavibacteria bacterium]HRB00831.1 hemerythrin domain-containing protein [Ignavibacteria bacterium]